MVPIYCREMCMVQKYKKRMVQLYCREIENTICTWTCHNLYFVVLMVQNKIHNVVRAPRTMLMVQIASPNTDIWWAGTNWPVPVMPRGGNTLKDRLEVTDWGPSADMPQVSDDDTDDDLIMPPLMIATSVGSVGGYVDAIHIPWIAGTNSFAPPLADVLLNQ